jgi:hypothetical protein
MFQRDALLIYLNQVLCTAGLPVIIILGGVVGVEWSSDRAYATVPFSMMLIGTTAFLLPSGRLMRRKGRRVGFLSASALGVLGSLILTLAVTRTSFALFCLGSFLYGAQNAFVRQYRFAIAENLPDARRATGISLLLTACIIAAIAGPMLVNAFPKKGSYVYIFNGLLAANIVSFISFLFYSPSRRASAQGSVGPRAVTEPLKEYGFLGSRKFWVPSLLDTTAFVIMVLLMTVTPLRMTVHAGCSMRNASHVVMGHVVCMYLPAFAAGWLIRYAGLTAVAVLGHLVLLASLAILLVSKAALTYGVGLALVGVGWNFLYVASTTLNSLNFRGPSSFLAQSTHEFVSMIFQCMISLLGGVLLFNAGWQNLNILAMTVLVVALGYFLLNKAAAMPVVPSRVE